MNPWMMALVVWIAFGLGHIIEIWPWRPLASAGGGNGQLPSTLLDKANSTSYYMNCATHCTTCYPSYRRPTPGHA